MKSGFREGEWGSFLGRVFSHRVGCGGISHVKELGVQCPSAHPQPLWAFHGRRLGGRGVRAGQGGSWELGPEMLKASLPEKGSAWVLGLQRKAWNILTGVETDRLGP